MQGRRVEPANGFVEFERAELEQSIPERFDKQVEKYADRLAVKGKSCELTYSELNESANHIARAILERRGEVEEPVTLIFDHDVPVIAAIFGALKAGKFYVPLDPSYPKARLAYMLADSQAGLVVTNTRNLSLAGELAPAGVELLNVDEIDPDLSTENPGLPIPPDALAHMLYTSGSTGQPKGVTQSHRNALHYTMFYTNKLHVCSDDRLAMLTSYGFSASLSNMFSSLLNGAALFPYDLKTDGVSNLADWFILNNISVCTMIPIIFRHFIGTLTGDEDFSKLRIVNLGGDRLYKTDLDLYRKYLPASCILGFGLGTSEAKSISIWFVDKETEITSSIVPTGYVMEEDVEVLLLDDDGKEVDPGQAGEIVVKSRYMSPGYWRRPELTEEIFKPDPEDTDKRLYYTGDLGLMLPDGCLMHLGRKDFQVKIRGHRIEIGEIEVALLDLDTVREALVVKKGDDSDHELLVAYVIPSTSQTPTVSSLRRELAETLPDYMIPSKFVMLDALPLTPTGKIDQRALPAPETSRPELETPFVSPRTPVEETLVGIWEEILGIEQVGINDNFLELGGHSLLATQVASRVLNKLQVEIPLQALFQSSTVADIAMVVTQRLSEKAEKEEIESVLSALDGLSDEEMGQLLEDENG